MQETALEGSEVRVGQQIGVGVIGTGFGARVHVPGFMAHPDTTVVALTASSPEKANAEARRLGVPHACASAEELIARPDVHLVAITTPPFLHHRTLLQAVQAGKHVLCEKPLALDAREGREMLAAARRAGVVAAVNHEFRYVPARARLGQLIREGYLGSPCLLDVVNLFPRRRSPRAAPWDWWSQAEKGGGVLGAIGSHYIDAARMWLGEITEVSALLDTYVRERRDPGTGEVRPVTSDDTASLLLRLGNGAQASIRLSSVSAGRLDRVVATGDAGTLVMENDDTLHGTAVGGESAQLPIPHELQLLPVGGERLLPPFLKLVSALVDALRGESSGVPTLEDGLRHQEVLDAARLASAERRWVRVSEVAQ